MSEQTKELPPVDPYLDGLRNDSLEYVVKEDKKVVETPEQMICRIYYHFKMKQVKNFPKLCQHAYRINKQNDKFLDDYGNKAKYTGSSGWSRDGTMKNKWILPTGLKLFMENLVYKRFWEEDNAKIRDAFMNEVCKGGTLFDYEQLLKKVVLYYGTDLKDTLGARATGSASIQ